MLPVNTGGHTAYQDFLFENLRKYYPNFDSFPSDVWDILDRFYYLDLSSVDESMRDRYSVFGPPPRLPSSMLRSMLAALEFGVTSYTDWAKQMKINPLFAIVSGFPFGDTPGVGTFYDFDHRLWLSDSPNLSPHERVPKSAVKKPSAKGDKAKPVEKITVEQLLKKFELEPPSTEVPYKKLFLIFKESFLDESVNRGLIHSETVSVAGDGTPVVTSARERKKRICDCMEKGISSCDCARYYSQPDCDIGWDSSRECFYHGYDLYLLTDAASGKDLPLFPMLGPASRHDSHGFLYTWFTAKQFLPDFQVTKLLLDSAHDAMPIYEYCKRENIIPFIDLNEKRGIKVKYKDDFTIGKDGVPVCKAGLKMHHDGVEKKKYRIKFRCPLANRKYGCTCDTPCSDSKYGRTVHLAMKDNPRLINIPPRDSDEWKKEYNARTSAERDNKRAKKDYKLEDGNHRSSREWYCRLFSIMMCQHLDAWDLPEDSVLRNRLKQAC